MGNFPLLCKTKGKGEKTPSLRIRILPLSQKSRALNLTVPPKTSQATPAQANRSHYPIQRSSYVKIGGCKESLIIVSGLAPSDTITRLWMVHRPRFHRQPTRHPLCHHPQLTWYLLSGPRVRSLLVLHQTALTFKSPLSGINDFSLPCIATHSPPPLLFFLEDMQH